MCEWLNTRLIEPLHGQEVLWTGIGGGYKYVAHFDANTPDMFPGPWWTPLPELPEDFLNPVNGWRLTYNDPPSIGQEVVASYTSGRKWVEVWDGRATHYPWWRETIEPPERGEEGG